MKAAGWTAAVLSLVFATFLMVGSPGLYPGPDPASRESSLPAPEISADSLRRRAEQVTVRIQSRLCHRISAGSGVIVDGDVLTNRHVVERSREITVSTWDGLSYRAGKNPLVSSELDVGRFPFPGEDPGDLARDPASLEPGERVLIAGYPRGERLEVEEGQFLGTVDGKKDLPELRFDGKAMVIKAPVWRGNSGGPVLDSQGRLAGIVFAGAFDKKGGRKADTAIAIPIDEIDALSEEDFTEVKPCRVVRKLSLRMRIPAYR